MLFKWCLRCNFNGVVNGRNVVNRANRPLDDDDNLAILKKRSSPNEVVGNVYAQ